ncbi:hypothetical protein F4781DRAFT_398239 [Annulohypoxylon bovei var. microspora]|nr:hypothetical protein F4781DRAFT_398239 [Annulohypoxylon bovei var. microspora]
MWALGILLNSTILIYNLQRPIPISCISMYLLAISCNGTPSITITRSMATVFILLFHVSDTLALPISSNTSITTYPPALAISGSPTNLGQNSDDLELQDKTYRLTVTGTLFAALSLCLSVVTTLISVVDFRLKIRDRTKSRRKGVKGVPRNPINDEAGREAHDALAQPYQPEDMNNSVRLGLSALSAIPKINGVPSPLLHKPRPSLLRPIHKIYNKEATYDGKQEQHIDGMPRKASPMPSERPSRSIRQAEPSRPNSKSRGSRLRCSKSEEDLKSYQRPSLLGG